MLTERPPSAKVLEKALGRIRGDLTVADAAVRAGLSLHEAEEGLRYLAAEFGGHLAATSKGELLYSFPKGLKRPPETRLLRRAWKATGKAIAGIGRFIVRAWVSVVMVVYALAFLAVLIALATRSDRDEGPGEAIGLVLRVVAEALFWTFHPFSPVYIAREPAWAHPRSRRRQPKIPFYEKVNRFVFGPPTPEKDPREQERNVVAEIRRQKGRVSPADVMRVTGLRREEAERLLLCLLVDYRGDIEVTEEGAILYKFTDLRVTAMEQNLPAPPPIWGERMNLPPLTGNTGGANVMFVFINGFNLAMSSYVLANDLTLERISLLVDNARQRFPEPLPAHDGSTPLLLGAVPLAFSAALFLMPMARALRRPAKRKEVGRENGWRGILRLALTGRRGRVALGHEELAQAWVQAGGHPPSESELRDAVREVGGEVDVNDKGELVYTFEVLEGELRASAAERAVASQDEASPGQIVYDSEDEGHGIRERQELEEFEVPGEARGVASGRRPVAALPERQQTIPDPREGRQPETIEQLMERLGVDTRGRRR